MINPMRSRTIALLLSLLLSSAYYLAVSTAASAQDPPPPPPPVKDYFPDKWDEYTSREGKFRIRFPKEPREFARTQGQFEVRSLEHKGLLHYRVSYVDYKTPLDDPKTVTGLLQGIKGAALGSIQGKGVRVVADREVTVDGRKGVYIHVEVEGKEVVRMQWVAAGSVLYTVGVSGRKGSPNEMEGKDDFEKVASGFIGSFHLTQ